MNTLSIYTLKAMRKIYYKCMGSKTISKPDCEEDPEEAAQLIYKALMSDRPCMIARFGSTEMSCLTNYIGISNHKNRPLDYIKGLTQPWWWDSQIARQMHQNAGFFPIEADKLDKFCMLMMQDISEVDILGSWLQEEIYFENQLRNALKVRILLLDPFWAANPWTRALKGKKVLVVHPFADTIQQQYRRRDLLFRNDILPEFELKTVKAVQSIAGEMTRFKGWFEALDYMKAEIDQNDFDICLIGAGAYGFPLAAHVKRMGKKGFHLGGSLQLLFGIRGKRWESETYSSDYNYAGLMNEYWMNPAEHERPANAVKVENACYW